MNDRYDPLIKQANALHDAYTASSKKVFTPLDQAADSMFGQRPFWDGWYEELWDYFRAIYYGGEMAINSILDHWSIPCQDKWWLMVQLARPAFHDAMMVILTPSWDEILEEAINPVSGRKGGKGGRGNRGPKRKTGPSGRRRRWWPEIPDVDSEIADKIPLADSIRGRPVGTGQLMVFKGINISDRVSWNWMLLELVSDIIYRWGSGMREARFCNPNVDCWVLRERNGELVWTANPPHPTDGWLIENEIRQSTLLGETYVKFEDINNIPIYCDGWAIYKRPWELFNNTSYIANLQVMQRATAWKGTVETASYGPVYTDISLAPWEKKVGSYDVALNFQDSDRVYIEVGFSGWMGGVKHMCGVGEFSVVGRIHGVEEL